MEKRRTVVIVATLDTRGLAAQFLREEIAARGLDTILIDPGILGAPKVPADITRWQVAESAGTSLEDLIVTREKQNSLAVQAEGLTRIVRRLHEQDRLDGILCLGGSLSVSIGVAAMRVLPVGMPKLVLTTIAAGSSTFAAFAATTDICMLHSVVDIVDVNAVTRPILSNAANAIAGMALHHTPITPEQAPVIGITRLAVTQQCVVRLKSLLEPQGCQVVTFPAGGTGGAAMEELVQAGVIAGVIDLSVHEVIDNLQGGIAGAPDRLKSLSMRGIPAVVSVGGMDHIAFESVEKAPEKYKNRPHAVDSTGMALFQPTAEEMEASARYLAEQLNRALGATIVIAPSIGFSDLNQPGRELWFPEGNRAAIQVLRNELHLEAPLIVVEAHINQPVFADVIAACMSRLLAGEPPGSIAARYRFG